MTQKAPRYTTDHFHEDVAAACGMSTTTPRPKYSVQVPCTCDGGRIELADGTDKMCLRCQGRGLVEGGL